MQSQASEFKQPSIFSSIAIEIQSIISNYEESKNIMPTLTPKGIYSWTQALLIMMSVIEKNDKLAFVDMIGLEARKNYYNVIQHFPIVEVVKYYESKQNITLENKSSTQSQLVTEEKDQKQSPTVNESLLNSKFDKIPDEKNITPSQNSTQKIFAEDAVNFFIESEILLLYQMFGFAIGGHKDETYKLANILIKKYYNDINENAFFKPLNDGLEFAEAKNVIKDKSLPPTAIYKAAKEKNKNQVVEALLTQVAYSSYNAVCNIPMSQLAMEKDIESLDFLNKSDCLLFLFTFTYALKGNIEAVSDRIKQIKKDHPEQIAIVLKGIVICLLEAECNEKNITLLKKIKEKSTSLLEEIKEKYPDQIGPTIIRMLTYYALSKQYIMFPALLEQLKNIYPDQMEAILKVGGFLFTISGNILVKDWLEKNIILIPNYISVVFQSIVAQWDGRKNKEIISALLFTLLKKTENSPLYVELYKNIKSNQLKLLLATQKKITQLEDNMPVKQALLWIQSEIQAYLLMNISLFRQKKLSPSICLHIHEYLIPLNRPDIIDISNRFLIPILKNRFLHNLSNKNKMLVKELPLNLMEIKDVNENILTDLDPIKKAFEKFPFYQIDKIVNVDTRVRPHDDVTDFNGKKYRVSYDAIYQDAKNGTLPEKIPYKLYHKHDYQHPIVRLAEELETKAVNILLPTSKALVPLAIFGYVSAGHSDEAMLLFNKPNLNTDKELKKEMENMIICGLAAGGFFDPTEESKPDSQVRCILEKDIFKWVVKEKLIFEKLLSNLEEKLTFWSYVGSGCAQRTDAGEKTWKCLLRLDAISKTVDTIYYRHPYNPLFAKSYLVLPINQIAISLALNGQENEINIFLQRIRENLPGYLLQSAMETIAVGFTLRGRRKEAYQLLETIAENCIKKPSLTETIKAIAKAEKQINSHLDISFIMKFLVCHLFENIRPIMENSTQKASILSEAFQLDTHVVIEMVRKAYTLREYMTSKNVTYNQMYGLTVDPIVKDSLISPEKLEQKSNPSPFLKQASEKEVSRLLNSLSLSSSSYSARFFNHLKENNTFVSETLKKPGDVQTDEPKPFRW